MNLEKYHTLFLDRDGVINHRIPGAYVRKWEEFDFVAGAVEAIAGFTKLFSRIVVVTNQQGIGKGLMTADDLGAVHQRMCAEIEKAGGKIDAVYFCPKLASENPDCRKPQTGMAMQAKKDFAEIDFSSSIMVGDSISDMGFGSKAGMYNVLIQSNFETAETLENVGLPEGYYINQSELTLWDFYKTLKKNTRENISSGTAWEDVVGYSRAVRIGNIVEVAGTTAMEGDQLVGKGDAYAQTKFVLQKIEKALKEVGASLSDVIRTKMYVKNISDWEKIGRAHGEFFHTIKPAATMVEVSRLIEEDLLVEIEVSAVLQNI